MRCDLAGLVNYEPVRSLTKKPEVAMRLTISLGMLLLAIWLILLGLRAFVPVVSGLGMLFDILAIAAGVLLLLGK